MENEFVLSTINDLEAKRASIDAAIDEKIQMVKAAQTGINYAALQTRERELLKSLETEKNLKDRILIINELNVVQKNIAKYQSAS